MRLVEGVVCEVVDFLVDGLRDGFRNPIRHTAGDIPCGVSVYEGVLFLLDLGGLFL